MLAKCAGKSTVAQYLIDHHGFKKLYLKVTESPSNASSGMSESETDPTIPDVADKSLPQHLKRATTPYTFSETTGLLDFVTKYWRSRWVTTDIHDEAILETLNKRPFFILISVDAPLTVRWQRYQRRLNKQQETNHQDPITLEEFVSQSDHHLYDAATGVLPLMSRAAIRLLNTSSNLAHFYATLGKLDLTNPDRLRPSWDSYFMSLASLAAHRCNCMKRAVGIKIVQVGISEVVYSQGYSMDTETAQVFRNAGIKLRQFSPPANGLVHLEKMDLY
ncbi:hypothetical protein ABKA04_003800 [Annulohypoxylon sp. FPYF3050]